MVHRNEVRKKTSFLLELRYLKKRKGKKLNKILIKKIVHWFFSFYSSLLKWIFLSSNNQNAAPKISIQLFLFQDNLPKLS